ncbi:GNAT family N-acetyltransferase [Xanthomonas campestris]|uniref:GNAT family N-acetyltransferase n=1 Tax=Xanthomonas campestris TaxID=339 RepID=UPI002006E96A|nr:GNAT family N-acetyltransferase [Xanthomonas campestris]
MDAKLQVAAPAQVLARKAVSLRASRVEDAAAWLAFLQSLDDETGFMLFEPGERASSVARYEDAIRRIHAVSGAMLLLLWNAAGHVVGYVKGDVVALKRKAHVMAFSGAVHSGYRGDTGRAILDLFTEQVGKEGVIYFSKTGSAAASGLSSWVPPWKSRSSCLTAATRMPNSSTGILICRR